MTTRVWWRLEQVLPLAEHAFASQCHQMTRAQVAAHAPDGPALTWTSTASGDRLASNGVPGWFTETGQPHHVLADTWQHTATGRTGSPGQLAEADGHVPLLWRDRPRGQRLVNRLRRGRTARQHWFVIDTHRAATRYQLRDHRDDIAPLHTRWVPATVTADAVFNLEYPALIADGYTALGGVIPTFDRSTVEQISGDLRHLWLGDMPGEHPIIELRGDIAVLSWEQDNGRYTAKIETDRVHPDPAGRYALGAYLFPWHLVGN